MVWVVFGLIFKFWMKRCAEKKGNQQRRNDQLVFKVCFSSQFFFKKKTKNKMTAQIIEFLDKKTNIKPISSFGPILNLIFKQVYNRFWGYPQSDSMKTVWVYLLFWIEQRSKALCIFGSVCGKNYKGGRRKYFLRQAESVFFLRILRKYFIP